MLNMADLHFSQYGGPYLRENSVIHYVSDPQVKEMKATNSS